MQLRIYIGRRLSDCKLKTKCEARATVGGRRWHVTSNVVSGFGTYCNCRRRCNQPFLHICPIFESDRISKAFVVHCFGTKDRRNVAILLAQINRALVAWRLYYPKQLELQVGLGQRHGRWDLKLFCQTKHFSVHFGHLSSYTHPSLNQNCPSKQRYLTTMAKTAPFGTWESPVSGPFQCLSFPTEIPFYLTTIITQPKRSRKA